MASRPLALFALLAIGLATNGCDTSPPAIPKNRMNELRRLMPGMTDECFETLGRKGIDSMSDNRWHLCVRMMAPERWKGIWLDGFEAQQFCPSPAKTCAPLLSGKVLWISFPNDEKPTGKASTDRLYEIEFIGRRTLMPGMHGHMGASEHEVLVDRLISVKPIPPRGDP